MWQRIGVVASVLWFLGGGMWQLEYDTDVAQKMMNAEYNLCTETRAQKQDYNFEPCSKESWKTHEVMMEGSGTKALMFAILPIILGWLFAYIVLWTTRWVLRGRKVEPKAPNSEID